MKKLFFTAAIAALSFACNNADKPAASNDSTAPAASAPAADSSAAGTKAPLKDGLMTLKGGKMMIVKAGSWAAMDSTVTCTNGRKVALDGTVSKGSKSRKLDEGMMIDKDGQIMDKDGKPMDTSGWD